MSLELIVLVYHICADYAAKYFNPDTCDFFSDSYFEKASENEKKKLLRLPDDEWQKAANIFIELNMDKKDRELFKERFDISNSNADYGYFWIEMEKLDLLYEWRNYYSDFLYKKAEKWCLDNNIPFIESVPREDIFCD